MTLTTTLTWRGNELFAGKVYIGIVHKLPPSRRVSQKKPWVYHLKSSERDASGDWDYDFTNEAGARVALEAKAKEALSNG